MKKFILFILVICCQTLAFAQHKADTVKTTPEFHALCNKTFKDMVAQKDYGSRVVVLAPPYDPNQKNANPQIQEMVLRLCPPVFQKGSQKVLYQVAEVKNTLIYPKANYRMENRNIVLLNEQLKPQFMSIAYNSDTSQSLRFTGVYKNEYLEFTQGAGKQQKFYYISPPNTNPDASANYLELHKKQMCFFKLSEDQQNKGISEVHLPMEYKYQWCTNAYGVKGDE